MRQRLRHRLVGLLLAPVGVVLAAGLSACTALPAEVPDDAVRQTGTTPPTRTLDDVTDATPAVGGDEMTRLITLCLARYGLADRPSTPDATASDDERLVAQQLQAEYDATLNDCTAEAMAAVASASPAPASPTPAS